ncbi:MAG: cupredoxin domain-containing protein [Pyrinomonadaceae bacterium]
MSKQAFMVSMVSILLFAGVMAPPGEALAGPKIQRVTITINKDGFAPAGMKLRKGVPAQVTFLRTTDATCAKEIVLPDFGIRRALPLNEPVVISFTPNKRGTFTFVCGMDMLRGQLIVQ